MPAQRRCARCGPKHPCQVTFSACNFNQTIPEALGSCVLVTGPLGSGKGTLVEAMAHELGKTIMAFDAALLAQPKPGTHLYCCGPAGFMKACAEASCHWPAGSVHDTDVREPAGAEQGMPPTTMLLMMPKLVPVKVTA